ncbi:MAG TPA: amidase family protein [Nakamurella sp.]
MDVSEYARYDGIGLRELIGTGQVSAAEVETAARAALDLADDAVNGLAGPMLAPALEHADAGPFSAVPFLIKDVPMAKGVPFAIGSASLVGILAQRDTDLMGRFRAAGLVTLGVTTMSEMGLSFSTESVKHGPTRNPWNLDRGVGGSSGGAAALVAAGAVPIAHANDGAGSIRIPASCCGLVGLKPSRGRTPCGPDAGEAAFGMSYDFALTRTVRDTAHLLDAVQGPGIGDKYTAPPPARRYALELYGEPLPMRVAVTTRPWSGSAVDPEVAAATVDVAHMLERSGHVVSEASPAVDGDAVLHSIRLEAASIASSFLLAPRPPDPARMEAVSRQALTEVKAMTALDLIAGFNAQNHVSRSVAAFFTRYDLLITPTLGQLPAPHGTLQYNNAAYTLTSWLRQLFEYGPFTTVFNISGQPAISLPLGQSRCGLPIGVQIVAPVGREDLLIQIAAQLEHAMPWNDRRPGFSVGRRLARSAGAGPAAPPA